MVSATLCPTLEILKSFSLGQISIEESDELTAHIHSCEKCRSDLETVADAQDSLIATLRDPDEFATYRDEPDCQIALAKALGTLGNVADVYRPDNSRSYVPDLIGEYEIVRPLGRGAMGRVYLGKHTKLGREVALKVVAHHRLADKHMRDRFEAEMQAIGRLSHPNIVTAHDAREVSGTAVLVTEYIDGFDLGQLLQRTGRLAVANACEIIRQVAVALEYTSAQGFVHRDVKPSNIMLGKNGAVKLLDLGLARFQFPDADRPDMTGTGRAMGTADFIAPEQVADSRSVDVRADIYALGCTLFKLLTGAAPFEDEHHTSAFAKMTAHVTAAPPAVTDCCPSIPRELGKLIASMLAKSPEHRPRNPMLVAQQLVPFTTNHDLVQLAHQAEISEPVHVDRSGSYVSGTVGRPQPFFRRRVPVSLLIATGLGALAAGFLLGVLLTIRNPDGTKTVVRVPDGGEITIAPDQNVAQPNTLSVTQPPATLSKPSTKTADEFAPLVFGIISDQERILPETSLQDGEPIESRNAIWYLLADNVNAPNVKVWAGRRYAPIELKPEARITWRDLQGHLSAQINTGGGSHDTRIDLQFDKQLQGKMKPLSNGFMNRQLAIILNNRIISAPFIRNEFGEHAQITGRLSPEETRYLTQALSGGLVEPPPERFPGTKNEPRKAGQPESESNTSHSQFPHDPWTPATSSLSSAVASFNEKARKNAIGKDQLPLTEDEVVASIRWMDEQRDTLTNGDIPQLQTIAGDRLIPPDWHLNVLTTVDGTDGERFEAWMIQLEKQRGADEQSVHRIRQQLLRQIDSAGKSIPLTEDSKAETKQIDATPLGAAINKFNAENNTACDMRQKPLTEEEVVAAIRWWKARRNDAPVTNGEFATFQKIAKTRELPKGADFEVIPTFQRDDGTSLCSWSVRIRIQKEGMTTATYAFVIREQYIRSEGPVNENTNIAWGKASPEGFQAGLRLMPSSSSYALGQEVQPTFYFRNMSKQPMELPFPKVMTRGYYEKIVTVDTTGTRVPIEQDTAPLGPVGWQRVSLAPDALHSVRGLPILLGPGARGSAETAIHVTAGQSVRLSFLLPSFKDGGKPLMTGEIAFTISEAELRGQLGLK